MLAIGGPPVAFKNVRLKKRYHFTSAYSGQESLGFSAFFFTCFFVSLCRRPTSKVFNSIDDYDVVRVYYNGRITYSKYVDLKTFCKMQFEDFPFDSHVCPINIEPWMLKSSEVMSWSLTGAKNIAIHTPLLETLQCTICYTTF